MPQPLSFLHVLPSFDLDARGARVARLMTAFGDRARHRLMVADATRLTARHRIGKGVRYEIAQEVLPLAGKPSLGRYEALAKLMRGHDLVLTYDWTAIDAVMARRVFARGLPPVIHHEDGFVGAEAGGLRRDRTIYRRLALSAAHALVVPSRALERIALETWKQPRARVHRIGNGVATALYAERPDPRALPGFVRHERELAIGAVGALLPHKDLPALVRAVGGLSARFRLVIVGDGPERAAVERAALAMGIDDRVVLTGAVERPYPYMGLFDLLALSSTSEQSPTSVVEAMAAGLPVVSPPVGDVAEMVAPENLPFVTEHPGEVRLRDAIQTLAGDPALRERIGAANRAKARAEFDEIDMIARYAALYAEVAGRPTCLG
ncbi:glycosyltransferase [Sphingomonas sp. BK345]|uniref:glycosyltransferase n=1 Tax=Sphingomonas sp. BK345 TaxID=2586980 RepID=UPI0016073308|nr:glycosyltransferase [Sphingomonas sp. BK345]MBB3474604.1 glycosyltransferase involved in cell wall biosynthesis [Sphingomonas sp. BK345]